MTTIENIVNPLPHVLATWNALLEKAGHTVWTVGAFAEPEPNESKKSPFLETQVQNLRASGQEYPMPDGNSYWSSWSATLITRASTMRGKNGDRHNALVGAVYVLAAKNRNLMSPFHVIRHFKPSGLVSSTDGLLDHSEIHMDIEVFVRDDAWPDA
ncbi:MAG: hypothetical protein QOI07_924 [Verrucomicrobiota bacterium]|jgi:hypothetical protein